MEEGAFELYPEGDQNINGREGDKGVSGRADSRDKGRVGIQCTAYAGSVNSLLLKSGP